MPNRTKEADRIESLIRGLLKLTENRRCINCNSLGPQYVCTTFWTFICTGCSGIHREFTHRVKSISMAKFTFEELSSLQAGGNQRAREIYFKDWDPHRHSLPDTSNFQRLRNFIKQVYVDRKYCGGNLSRHVDTLPSVKVGNREDFFENRKAGGAHHSGSRSLHFSGKPSLGGRNDNRNFGQESSRHGSCRSSPVRFEIVDDRVRDNGFGSGRWSPNTRLPKDESKQARKSIDAPPPSVKGLPNANNNVVDKDSPSSAKIQGPHSSNQAPGEANVQEHKDVTSESLIDFKTDPQHPDVAEVSQTEKDPLSTNGGDCWAAFASSQVKASQASCANTNSLECLLLELSVPPAAPVCNTSAVCISGAVPLETTVGGMGSTSVESESTTVESAPLVASGHGDPIAKVTDDQKLITALQHQTSASCAADGGTFPQQAVPSGGVLDNQPLASSLAPNTQVHVSASPQHLSQSALKAAQDSQPPPSETNCSARRELPVDLFAASYSSLPTHASWRAIPPQTMGFNTHYHPTMMSVPAFPNSAKTANPFDLNDETTQARNQPQNRPQNQHFGSMASLQGALPNVFDMASMHGPRFGARPTGLMPPQWPSYAPVRPPSPSCSPSAMPQRAYGGQQAFTNAHSARPEDVGTWGTMSSMNTNQQLRGRSPAPGTQAPDTQSSFPEMSGNPFG